MANEFLLGGINALFPSDIDHVDGLGVSGFDFLMMDSALGEFQINPLWMKAFKLSWFIEIRIVWEGIVDGIYHF